MKQDYRWETPGLAFFNFILMEMGDFAMERRMLEGHQETRRVGRAWSLIPIGTVIAVDRLGVGKSDRPTEPQTGEVIVATLRSLLAQAGVPPPYVLVGHSLGGLHVELFARRHPDEVAASCSSRRPARTRRRTRRARVGWRE